jgi:histidinol-phosphate phosphatase family protein
MDDLENIHRKLETLLGEQGVYVNDIFYCPHHPDRGYPEENEAYKIPCDCRKPKTGLIMEAASKYNIDLVHSFIIGDSTIDIQTGFNAGLKTILLSTGLGGNDRKYSVLPDYYAKNLLDALNFILV